MSCFSKCFQNKASMTGWILCLNSHSQTSVNLGRYLGEVSRDCHLGRPVGGVSKAFEVGISLALSLESGWVARLHVDAEDVSTFVLHGDPDTAMTVLHARLLDVIQQQGERWHFSRFAP